MLQDQTHAASSLSPMQEDLQPRHLVRSLGRSVFDALEAGSRRVFTSTGFSDWFGLERPIAPRNIDLNE